jgi:hypothetical protein
MEVLKNETFLECSKLKFWHTKSDFLELQNFVEVEFWKTMN